MALFDLGAKRIAFVFAMVAFGVGLGTAVPTSRASEHGHGHEHVERDGGAIVRGPIADAGRDRRARVGEVIVLDGSASVSPRGDALSYQWTVVSKPRGSAARLSDATAIRPSFTVDVAGDYVLRLTLRSSSYSGDRRSDGDDEHDAALKASISKADVVVSTTNVRPVARAGLDRLVAIGTPVLFDGSGSFDADGDVISHAWTLVEKPTGSQATLSSATVVRPGLMPDVAGRYVAHLVVKDVLGHVSAPATVVFSTKTDLPVRPAAGPSQATTIGATVRLDADGSYDPNGTGRSANWALIGRPRASAANLALGADARQAFKADVAGDYVAQIDVAASAGGATGDGGRDDDHERGCRRCGPHDGLHSVEEFCARAVAHQFGTVLVTSGNVAPQASAGSDQKVAAGASVRLDASGSTDVNGDRLTYRWSLITVPAGSTAKLSDAAAVRPGFVADVAGDYVAQVIVSDGKTQSWPATVVVSSSVGAPTANAGRDERGKSEQTVQLNGSASATPNGDTLSAAWSNLGLGDQVAGVIAAPTRLQTTFKFPTAGIPLEQAVLTGPVFLPIAGGSDDDERRHTGPSSMTLASKGKVISAGRTYSVWRIRNYGGKAQAAILDLPSAGVSKAVTVPAGQEAFLVSPAAVATPPHRLVVGKSVVATVKMIDVAFTYGRHVNGGRPLLLTVLQLVTGSGGLARFDTVVLSSVETRPTAEIASPAGGLLGTPVVLDGSASYNPNATPTTAGLTRRWALLSAPTGSKAVLSNATAASASFVPDAFGDYVVQSIVSDGTLDSRPRTVLVTLVDQPPVASLSAPATTKVGQTITLDGSASRDPEGAALSYDWKTTKTPSGSTAALSGANTAKPGFKPDVAGTYGFQLVVSDGRQSSTAATASVVAEAAGFAFDPLAAQKVDLGSRLKFTVRAVDPNGKPVTYAIASGVLPAGASFDVATGTFSYRPLSNVPATVTVVFSASNGTVTTTQSVPISIAGSPSGTAAALQARIYDAVDYARGVLTPVSGASISVGGGAAISSDATGAVALAGLPTGKVTLTVSGAGAAVAPDGSHYADTFVAASLIAGVTNTLDGPILLGRQSGGTPVTPDQATVVTNPTLAVTLTILPNSAKDASGALYGGTISIGSIPAGTPIGLPRGYAPCQLLTISPVGVTFDPPALLSVQNSDRLPAGTQVDLWAFDAALSNTRVVGIGEVSADGATISVKVGGVPGGTVLAMAPRRAAVIPSALQPKDRFIPSVLGTGDMAAAFAPAGIRRLDADRSISFLYHSSTADARQILKNTTTVPQNTGIPGALETHLTLAGVDQSTVLSSSLTTPLRAGAPALTTEKNASIVQAAVVDGTALGTGVHPYSFLTLSKFACSTVAAEVEGEVLVNDQSKSPIGAGWQIAELQKLTKQPDGSVVVTQGDGQALVMRPQQAPDFDLPNPVYVPINGPFLGTTADLLGDGRPSILRLGWKDGSLNVILNKGGRKFVKSATTVIGDRGALKPDGTLDVDVADLAAGDVTGDGLVDVAFLNSKHNQAKILLGATGGTFLTVPLEVESNGPGGGIVMGDFIGDGNGHLMMSENQGGWPDFHVIYNDGKNNFTFHHDAPYLAGDNEMHVKVRLPGFQHDTVVGLLKPGTLTFQYGGSTSTRWRDGSWSRGPSNLGYAEIDNDEAGIDTLQLPTPLAPFGPSRTLATADLDGTGGYPSFAVASATAIHIVRWYGPGAYNQQVVQTLTLPNGLAPDSVTLAPLAKGDKPALIVTARTAGFYVFTNDGTGKLATTPVFVATPFRVGIQSDVVDFDGDGVADIALSDLDNDRVAIFFGKPNRNGHFVAPIGDYTRLVQNADGTYARIYNDGTRVTFNGEGYQTAMVDANGNTTSYAYNGSGQLTQIVEPTGSATSFTYAGAWLASMRDPAGRTTSFEHDASGNLTKVTDPAGAVTQYLYDAANRLVKTIDPNGAATANVYTATGQLKQQTYPDGTSVKLDVSRTLGLDALGVDLNGPANPAYVTPEARITLFQDAKGNASETEVNEWGAVVRTVDAIGRETLFWRDGANHVVASLVPAGVATGPAAPTTAGTPRVASSDSLANDYVYDTSGNLLSLHEGVGHLEVDPTRTPIERWTRWEYEPSFGKVSKKTDPDGFVTKWEYDAKGNMVRMIDALDHAATYAYDSRGLETARTDVMGRVTRRSYDAAGNVTRVTDALGTNFDSYYDAAGNVVMTIDAVGTTVERRRSYQYDAANRLTVETSATGENTLHAYDRAGNEVQTSDPAGNVTTRVWDGNGRLVSQSDPASGTTTQAYDENGNLVSITDASGAVTTVAYDAMGRAIASTDALGASTAATWDLRNALASFTNARGKTTRFANDAYGRLAVRRTPADRAWYYTYDRRGNVSVTLSGGGTFTRIFRDGLSRIVGDDINEYGWDDAGNLTNTFNNFPLILRYDALDRKIAEEKGGLANPATLTYTYDELGRRTSMTDSFGGTTTYGWDREDRLTRIVTPWGAELTQTYDVAGRPARLAYPNGLDADLTFEARTGRLASLQHRAGSLAAPVASYTHTYDAVGGVATQSELTNTRSFTYDKAHRLTGVGRTVPAPATQVESYTYDPAGNRIASHTQAAISVDDDDRLLDDGLFTYGWSGDGGLTSRVAKAGGAEQRFSHQWIGLRNQAMLRSISDVADFYYDAFGRRTATVWATGGGNVDSYTDGPDVALELRNVFGGANRRWVRYVHGADDDQILAMELYPLGADPVPGTGQQYYFHPDAEGSVRLVTDAAAQVANRYDYDSYGRRVSVVESVAQPYGWKGREFIPGAELYYNRARFYDPVMGRFISEDPLGYDGGDTNLYGFAWNDPKNWNDPSGLSAGVEYGAGNGAGQRAGPGAATVGMRIACVLFALADVVAAATEQDTTGLLLASADLVSCRAVVSPKLRKPPAKSPTCPLRGFSSFEASTLIEEIGGMKSIDHVQIGDLVASRDTFTGEKTFRPVTNLFSRTAPSITHLTLDSASGRREKLDVTSEHPLFVEGRGWTEVRRLVPGDHVVSESGTPLVVAEVSSEFAPTRVYNFEVGQDHSYFAGGEGAWSHNGFGVYIIKLAKGGYYIGKGALDRAKRSGKRLNGVICYTEELFDDISSFIREDELIESYGGVGKNPNLPENKRNSPGKRLRGR